MRGSCASTQSRRMRMASAAVFGRRPPLPPHQQLVTIAAVLCLVAVVLSAMIVSGDLPWIRPGRTLFIMMCIAIYSGCSRVEVDNHMYSISMFPSSLVMRGLVQTIFAENNVILTLCFTPLPPHNVTCLPRARRRCPVSSLETSCVLPPPKRHFDVIFTKIVLTRPLKHVVICDRQYKRHNSNLYNSSGCSYVQRGGVHG